MDWLQAGLAPLKDLIAFLHSKTKTHDFQKKRVIMELRDNLNVFRNGFLNDSTPDTILDLLSNEALQEAVRQNFPFRRLKAGKIRLAVIRDERNRKYAGWTAEKLAEKIDEKIVELRNIKKLNRGSLGSAKNNVSLMMGNLYYRMKLLADFIRS